MFSTLPVVQADVHAPPSAELHPTPGAIGNVDDFVPDDDVTFSSFLDDRDASSATTLSVAAEESARYCYLFPRGGCASNRRKREHYKVH